MKALFILLSPFLLISASHLTDAAVAADAQKADSTIVGPPPQGLAVGDGQGGQPFPLPYYHPNIHFGNDGESVKTASGNGGLASAAAPHPDVLVQQLSQFIDARDEVERKAAQATGKATNDLVGDDGFFNAPPPTPLKQQQQPPAAHPHMLFQRPSTWTDVRDAAEQAAAQAAGKAAGETVGKAVGDALSREMGDLLGYGGFPIAPPPVYPPKQQQQPPVYPSKQQQQQQQQPPAVHPKVRLQRPSALGDIWNGAGKAVIGVGNLIGDLIGR